MNQNKNDKSRNPDPITKAPGSHPVGTGVGAAAGGAATGAAIGSAAGPAGTVAGVAGGAIVGGLVGKGVAEHINPTQEDTYWRHNHYREPYGARPYTDYQSAYRVGYEGYSSLGGGDFEARESELRRRYEADKASARLPWSDARQAARAAWHRLEGNPERLIGYDVQDQSGHSVGTVHSVWTDEARQPVFIGVKTGWIFGKTHVVPADRATVNQIRRTVQLPFAESLMKDAPSFDASSDLSDDDEAAVRRHFGITAGTPGSAKSAANQSSSSQPSTAAGAGRVEDEKTIALREEKLKVGKRDVEAGGVRIRKIVRTETVTQPVELRREELVVERVPAGEMHGTEGRGTIGEEDIFVPLRREEAVIEKDTVVREGVRIGKKAETERQTVSEQVRKEDVEIDRQAGRDKPNR